LPADTTPTGVSVTFVTVVDVAKPPVMSSTIPGTVAGEIALFAPGFATFTRSLGSYASDISLLNTSGARSVNDLRLFFTPAGSSQTNVASLPSVPSAQSVTLVNAVTNVYGVSEGIGTLQIRSVDWQNIAAYARLTNSRPTGALLGDVP